jgi:phenylacetate-CoA ligase
MSDARSSAILAPAPRDHSQQCWDSEVQLMDVEQLTALRLTRCRDMIDRALIRPVPHFQRKLADAGIGSGNDLERLEQLQAVAMTTKDELRASETAHPPVGDYRFFDLHDAARLGTSGGTTGQPTHILWTQHDIWVDNDTAARTYWRRGLRPGAIVTQASPAYLYTGGLIIQSSYEYFGCLCLWVPPPDTDEAAEAGIRMWQRIPPDVPFNMFSVGRFKEVAQKMGLDPEADLGLTSGFTSSQGDADLPMLSAGSECFTYLGSPCAEDNGAHLADDYTYVEAVDPETGQAVPDNEWGLMVVTTFGRDGCLLRYAVGDICRLDRQPCPCGETSIRGWWGGRLQDLLRVQGRRIPIQKIEGALSTIALINRPSVEFEVIRPTDEAALLQLRVEARPDDADQADAAVSAELEKSFGIKSAVEIVEPGSLPRYAFKPVRVVDA